MSSINKIAEEVRARLPDGSGDEGRTAIRARLVAEADREARPKSRLVPVAVGVCLASAAAVAFLVAVVLPEREGTISCLKEGIEPVEEGAWINASADRPLQLLFSEQSEMVLEPRTNARLVELARKRVRVHLETGDIDVRIKTDGERDWLLDAGPFAVRVTGTVFSLRWAPAKKKLRVEVREGEVEVSGGPLRRRVVAVQAGERFQAAGEKFEVAALTAKSQGLPEGGRATAQGNPFSSPTDTEAPGEPGSEDLQEASASISDPRGDRRDERRSWRTLAKVGDHEAAAKEAEKIGIKKLARDLDARSAILLADTLRLTGRDEGAKVVLKEIRRRFPKKRAARAAAFRLGRIAADRGKHEEALERFAVLVREAPESEFAEKARGRMIEAHLALGNRKEARRQAEAYLERHPRGSYESAARQLLSETGD